MKRHFLYGSIIYLKKNMKKGVECETAIKSGLRMREARGEKKTSEKENWGSEGVTDGDEKVRIECIVFRLKNLFDQRDTCNTFNSTTPVDNPESKTAKWYFSCVAILTFMISRDTLGNELITLTDISSN